MKLAFPAIAVTAAALLSLPASIASAGGEGRIITLSDPAAIADAQAVSAAIDAAADAAAHCRKTTSRTPLQCECDSKVEMARLKSAFEAAAARHPEWPQPGITVYAWGTNLNFSAIGRAVATCP
ncbi:MAG TPA: hypothetical protein VFW39_01855 [Sphingomicrobium sp.]|nr:hypothetical protein [Sphingomicrobium sp.]